MISYSTAIDLFCGCGGFSLGFIKAGFEVVAALDIDVMALATYYANLCNENTKIIGEIPRKHSQWFTKLNGWRFKQLNQPPPIRALFYKNILEVLGWDMLDVAGLDTVDVIIGSPPCQSFSTCNTCKKEVDFRDFLMFE